MCASASIQSIPHLPFLSISPGSLIFVPVIEQVLIGDLDASSILGSAAG